MESRTGGENEAMGGKNAADERSRNGKGDAAAETKLLPNVRLILFSISRF